MRGSGSWRRRQGGKRLTTTYHSVLHHVTSSTSAWRHTSSNASNGGMLCKVRTGVSLMIVHVSASGCAFRCTALPRTLRHLGQPLWRLPSSSASNSLCSYVDVGIVTARVLGLALLLRVDFPADEGGNRHNHPCQQLPLRRWASVAWSGRTSKGGGPAANKSQGAHEAPCLPSSGLSARFTRQRPGSAAPLEADAACCLPPSGPSALPPGDSPRAAPAPPAAPALAHP